MMGLVRFLRRLVFRRKRSSSDRIAAVDFETQPELSWDHVQKLSMDFSKVIGYGGFSTVYLAHFCEDVLAAVKRYPSSQRLYQVYKRELGILQRLHHPNIIQLLGYCNNDQEEGVLLLEYIPNGNLQEKLHGPNNATSSLPWKLRMAIAFQLAEAVSYLHNTCVPHVVHGDIKPSNILLDSNLNCKLCDFGSATTAPHLSKNDRKLIMTGSPGYTDPAYIKTGLASKENDVYSLGVVMLELITGMGGVDQESGERLVTRVDPMMKDVTKVGEMVDGRLNGEVDMEEARVMVGLAARCVCGSTATRPSASEIVSIMRSRVYGSLSFLFEKESL